MHLGGRPRAPLRRLCFVNRFFFPDESATAQLLTDLCSDLTRAGFDVQVVTSRQRYNDPRAGLPAFEVIDGVAIHRVRTAQFGRARLLGRLLDYASFYLSSALKLLAIVKRGDIVVSKTDPPLISIVAAAVCALRGARLINWLQDVFPEVAEELGVPLIRGPVGRCLKAARNVTLRYAAVNVTLGARMSSFLEKQTGGKASFKVIHNWADGNRVVPKSSRGTVRAQLHLQDEFVVMYAGNIGRAHDFETVLLAAEALRERLDIVFLFVGYGSKYQALQSFVAEKGIKNVKFMPPQPRDQLRELLSAADVHLVTLLPELEGLVVPSKFYGVMAAARPTAFVGDLNGEVAQMVRRHGCGVCVKAGDWNELASQIVRLEADRVAAFSLGSQGRSAFLAHYDRSVAVKEWARLLG